MRSEQSIRYQSVTGVCIREDQVLLVRLTYGKRKGQLILPGGYLEQGETPQMALKREFMEETGVEVEPGDLIGIRFNMQDWYVAFRADYVSGEARSDGDENSEAVWMDVSEALTSEDVPELTAILIRSAAAGGNGLVYTDFESAYHPPYSLYCAGELEEY